MGFKKYDFRFKIPTFLTLKFIPDFDFIVIHCFLFASLFSFSFSCFVIFVLWIEMMRGFCSVIDWV